MIMKVTTHKICTTCKKQDDFPFRVLMRANPLTGEKSYRCDDCEREMWVRMKEHLDKGVAK